MVSLLCAFQVHRHHILLILHRFAQFLPAWVKGLREMPRNFQDILGPFLPKPDPIIAIFNRATPVLAAIALYRDGLKLALFCEVKESTVP